MIFYLYFYVASCWTTTAATRHCWSVHARPFGRQGDIERECTCQLSASFHPSIRPVVYIFFYISLFHVFVILFMFFRSYSHPLRDFALQTIPSFLILRNLRMFRCVFLWWISPLYTPRFHATATRRDNKVCSITQSCKSLLMWPLALLYIYSLQIEWLFSCRYGRY